MSREAPPEGWSRRSLAALAPLILAACAGAPPPQPLVSVNLLDTEPPPAPPPLENGRALLETAFDAAKRMTVPVLLNGQGPFQFVVDTGANRSVVAREVAARVGLASAGQAPVHGIAGVEPTDLVLVKRLRVGEVTTNNLALPSLPRSRLGVDGLLGVDVMRGRSVRLDFVFNSFEISDSHTGAVMGREHGSRLPTRFEPVHVPAQIRFGQLVIVDAEVAGIHLSAFLDSGSQVTVGNRALRDAVVRTRPDFGVNLAPVPLISATGQTATGEFGRLKSIRLGGLAVTELTAIFADLHIFELWQLTDRPALLVGIDVLRHFRDVTLDFGRREVIFNPPLPGRRTVPAGGF